MKRSRPAKKKHDTVPILTAAGLAREVARLFPPHLAEPWDNVGLQIGDPAARVLRVMTCLEVTAPTLEEARKLKVDTIISHHPLVFRPMKTILASNPAELLAAELLRARMNLIVAHTNLDAAPWGTNQVLAEACGLTPTGPLDPRPLDPNEISDICKFVVFTPQGHESAVIDAIDRGGGGKIGLYTHCTFRGLGTGTFKGGEGSKPFIGEAGKFEEAFEFRIESVVPRQARASVLREVLMVHPYEEPAYEFYVLATQGAQAGLGCIAMAQRPLSFEMFISRVKKGLGIRQVRISGPVPREIRRVAICSGSGGGFLAKAASLGVDAYLTGEINYHSGIEAHQRGIAVVEVGHFESERIIAPRLAERLSELPTVVAARVQIKPADGELQPFVLT